MIRILSEAVKVTGFAALAVALAGGAALAQPKLLQKFNNWEAYVHEAGGTKLCFAISRPVKQDVPQGRNRGEPYIFVSYRPKENVKSEVSITYGYPLETDSTRAVVGSDEFPLLSKEESAWLRNATEEPRMVSAMRAGSNMQVYGTSTRGTKTVDTYSLSGITAALERAEKECAS